MKKLMPVLLAILASCASEPTVERRSDARVFHLKHANAPAMVRTFAKGALLEELAADARSNAIIAKGSKEELDRLEARIQRLDRESF